jgi:hypothetical protein
MNKGSQISLGVESTSEQLLTWTNDRNGINKRTSIQVVDAANDTRMDGRCNNDRFFFNYKHVLLFLLDK